MVPWDCEVFGVPVAQIHDLQVADAASSDTGWQEVQAWLSTQGVRILSCRLPMDRLRESMLLERHGFRFIEVVLHPSLPDLQSRDLGRDGLDIVAAGSLDIPLLTDIAGSAFRHERYHVDPRLDPEFSALRYQRWVSTSLDHPTQQLLKVLDGDRVVGFFVLEHQPGGQVYWHLNAIAPDCQGRGYGRRAWRAMLHRHQAEGVRAVTTTVSARNVAVQSLYASLGFRFLPPEMTFHWIRAYP
jgi:ribosomal protein S18 acetylase RimI-like enzyme